MKLIFYSASKKDAKYIKEAKRRLLELKLVVYDIRIEF
jgi:hypothetical protein